MRILIFFLAFCSTFAFRKSIPERHAQTIPAQEEQSDTLIPWKKDQKLTWNDFQAKPDEKREYKAITTINVIYSHELFPDHIDYVVSCVFVKSKSWTKLNSSLSLLKHEQLHFDIAELIARKIRKDLSIHVSNSLSATQTYVKTINHKYYDVELDSLNAKYDGETNHGTIEAKQKTWETKIANELKKYEKYSSTKVVIKRVVKP